MEKVRIGIIGCGTVASYGHIPAACSTAECDLVAISDINEARLQELKDKHGIAETYTDYRKMLERPDIEAVGVAVPVGSHPPVVMDALKAGKHVFCEKPIAQTVQQGEEMVKCAEEAGKLLAIDFEKRNTEPFPTIKRLLEEGKIGKLKVIRCIANWQGGRWAGEDRYRMLITEGLGPIVDCGIHDFDAVRWLSGAEFAEVHAFGTNIEDWPNPDHVMATCRMTNGVLVHIEAGWAYTHTTPQKEANLRTDLIGTDGVLSYADWQTSIEGQQTRREFSIYSKEECIRRPVESKAKAFGLMYSLLARSIREGRLIDLPSGYDGVQALRAALQALEQAKRV